MFLCFKRAFRRSAVAILTIFFSSDPNKTLFLLCFLQNTFLLLFLFLFAIKKNNIPRYVMFLCCSPLRYVAVVVAVDLKQGEAAEA
jgi:hypothetical protein